jgi:putative ABC transport system permease protein
MRDTLMSAEIACTVVLLVGAGLLIRSFVTLRGTNPGFAPERVLSLHFAVDRARHGSQDRDVARYLGRMIEQVRTVPGVQSAAVVNRFPLSGQLQTMMLEFEGRSGRASVDSRSVSSDYFQTLGIPVIAGRVFRDTDTEGRPDVGVLDERIARQYFGSESPIGKRFRIPIEGMPWVEVVGVVAHIRSDDLESDARAQVYWPYQQRTQDRMALAVKTAGPPAAMTKAVRAAIRAVDPDQALYDVRPMTEVVERTLLAQRLNVVLVGSFALLALVLAAAGLYGVVSQLTARRTREFGIRLAVGADPANLRRLVIRQALARGTAGLVAGLALSAAVTRLLTGMIHGVASFDPLTYAAVAALLLTVVAGAAYVPARRASKTDPIIALRCE